MPSTVYTKYTLSQKFSASPLRQTVFWQSIAAIPRSAYLICQIPHSAVFPESLVFNHPLIIAVNCFEFLGNENRTSQETQLLRNRVKTSLFFTIVVVDGSLTIPPILLLAATFGSVWLNLSLSLLLAADYTLFNSHLAVCMVSCCIVVPRKYCVTSLSGLSLSSTPAHTVATARSRTWRRRRRQRYGWTESRSDH